MCICDLFETTFRRRKPTPERDPLDQPHKWFMRCRWNYERNDWDAIDTVRRVPFATQQQILNRAYADKLRGEPARLENCDGW